MRLTTLAALAALTLTACIQEDPTGNDDISIACAPAPSGAGSWEDWSEEGLHCNYEDNNSGEWAYSLNSNESGCMTRSWAPYQPDGGRVEMWTRNGNRGCDWVIPWE